jgi:hypothetical protein
MRVYANPDGTIAAYTPGFEDPPNPAHRPPPGIVPLEFDEESNPVVVAMLLHRTRDLRLANGVLTLDGAAVKILAESPARLERKAIDALRAKLEADQAPTAAELRLVLRFLLRRSR